MGVLLSLFFSVSGIQTVVACMVLRRVRNLGAIKGQIGSALPHRKRTSASDNSKAHCKFYACLDFYHAG